MSFDSSMSPLSLAASLIVACGAEAGVLDLCCGIRGEYRYGKDKAEALLAQEKGCAPSGEYWFASMCTFVLPAPGTRVPAFCTRLFPRIPDVLESRYTCTRILYPLVPPCPRRSRTRIHVYPRFVPAFPSVLHTFCVVYRRSAACGGGLLRLPGCSAGPRRRAPRRLRVWCLQCRASVGASVPRTAPPYPQCSAAPRGQAVRIPSSSSSNSSSTTRGQRRRLPSEASVTRTVFGYSFQDIITCDDERLLEIRKKCVKWIKHIDFEISSRKEDKDEELLQLEGDTLRDAMARGERARARDKAMADALGQAEGEGEAEGGDGDQCGGDGGGDVDPGGGDVDQGGGDGGGDADPSGGDRGVDVDAEDPKDADVDVEDPKDADVDAKDPKDEDMQPEDHGDRDEDRDPGVGGSVKDSGLGSDTSHLSDRSMDVCGDCGPFPCMCGPTRQVIPGSAGETVAEAEAEAEAKAAAAARTDAEAYAEFKAREELEQMQFYTLVCPGCKMKHLWRLGGEPWGTCCCGLAMGRDESASTSEGTSEVCVCLQCVVCAVSSAAGGNTGGTRVQNAGTRVPGVVECSQRPGTTGYKTRVQSGTCPLLYRKAKKRRTAADVRQEQFAARQAALLAAHQRTSPPPPTGKPLLSLDEAHGCGS